MRKLTTGVLFGLLLSGGCLGQANAESQRSLYLAQVFDTLADVQILSKLIPLQLTDQQMQCLVALFQQYPREDLNLAAAREAAEKFEQCRTRLISGAIIEKGGAEEQALQQALQSAFSEFSGKQQSDDKSVTQLTPEESATWGLLTPTQQGVLLGLTEGDAAPNSAARVLRIIGLLRGKEASVWAASRDRLATSVAAAADPPVRDNTRLTLLDFLNRLRSMSDVQFLEKHKELAVELGILLPPGTNVAPVIAEFDPGQLHNALVPVLSPRTPPLLQKMQAARASKAAH
ncbi:MAG: hypothetical protein ACYC63_12245 [Armatimonadota bacterium]